MPGNLILMIVCVILLIPAVGLPLLLKPGSPVPDYIGLGLLAAMIAFAIWTAGDWWLLLAIAALVALVIRMDRDGQASPVAYADLDRRGWSKRTRLHLRLGCASQLAGLALLGSLFILPAYITRTFAFPGMIIVFTAMSLFRLSFYRSWRRDDLIPSPPGAPASPASFG